MGHSRADREHRQVTGWAACTLIALIAEHERGVAFALVTRSRARKPVAVWARAVAKGKATDETRAIIDTLVKALGWDVRTLQ